MKTVKFLYARAIALPALLMLTVSCSEKEIPVTEAVTEPLCRIEENISGISEVFSFAVAESGEFVLCDNREVYLYSKDGQQLRKIGMEGRAKYEYNMPSQVGICNDTIYVWSSMTLKFITYTMDGMPAAEYKYKSAIRDFVPSDDKIYIYAAGMAEGNVIDVLDKSSGDVEISMTETSAAHKLLLSNWSASPILLKDGKLYYSSLDNLEVNEYTSPASSPASLGKVKSATFSVVQVAESNDIADERQTMLEYLMTNSQVIGLFSEEDNLYAVALEGTAPKNGKRYDRSVRTFSLYEISARGKMIMKPVARYSYNSIGTELLLKGFGNDGLYIIKHSVADGEDVYSLEKLIF